MISYIGTLSKVCFMQDIGFDIKNQNYSFFL